VLGNNGARFRQRLVIKCEAVVERVQNRATACMHRPQVDGLRTVTTQQTAVILACKAAALSTLMNDLGQR
jgi:hypothetical protein